MSQISVSRTVVEFCKGGINGAFKKAFIRRVAFRRDDAQLDADRDVGETDAHSGGTRAGFEDSCFNKRAPKRARSARVVANVVRDAVDQEAPLGSRQR